MVKIKVVVGTKKGKTYQKELDGNKISPLIGLKIGESFDGSLIGLTNYKLEVRGASDKQGFPSRKSLEGSFRKKLILRGGVGFKKIKKEGMRKRKSVRGNTISEETAQLNVKVITEGKEPIEKLWGFLEEKETKEQKEDVQEKGK